MSSDTRRATRHPLPEAIHASDAMTGDIVGRIANLSAGGMLLLTRSPLLEDALYQLRFALPRAQGGHDALETGAQALWVEPDRHSAQYWIGLRFLGLGGEAARLLALWLEAQQPANPDAP